MLQQARTQGVKCGGPVTRAAYSGCALAAVSSLTMVSISGPMAWDSGPAVSLCKECTGYGDTQITWASLSATFPGLASPWNNTKSCAVPYHRHADLNKAPAGSGTM